MKNKFILLVLGIGFFNMTGAWAAVIESVNSSSNPCCYWGAGEVGWLYTPSQSYSLTGINTKFSGSVDNRTVTIEVYDDAPPNGGNLLGSADFIPVAQAFSGGDFLTPISFVAGQDYFIGFNNIARIGANVTLDTGAGFLDFYSGTSTDGSYDDYFYPDSSEGITNSPILQFVSTLTPVPIPAAVWLFGSALGLLGWMTYRKAA